MRRLSVLAFGPIFQKGLNTRGKTGPKCFGVCLSHEAVTAEFAQPWRDGLFTAAFSHRRIRRHPTGDGDLAPLTRVNVRRSGDQYCQNRNDLGSLARQASARKLKQTRSCVGIGRTYFVRRSGPRRVLGRAGIDESAYGVYAIMVTENFVILGDEGPARGTPRSVAQESAIGRYEYRVMAAGRAAGGGVAPAILASGGRRAAHRSVSSDRAERCEPGKTARRQSA